MGEKTIKAVIVEDDLMVASINKQYISMVPEIAVKATFHNGKDAWEFISNTETDLIILDEYMPGLSGLELLSRIRFAGIQTDVIMVTAANDSLSVETALRLGVLDYLVKPFSYQRFWEAVQKYLTKRQILKGSENFSQIVIDRMIGPAVGRKESELSKGLQDKTLNKIHSYIKEKHDVFLTCEEIARMSGLSRVTVRRYMNYLIELNEVVSEVDYQTGGRPSIKYRSIN